ncbi:MAG: efflux RND transporter permease subunit, partial [Candidatus Binatia bacterium]
GAESRRPLGLAVVGGLLVSQLLTLYITPVVYLYLEDLKGYLGSVAARVRAHRAIRRAEANAEGYEGKTGLRRWETPGESRQHHGDDLIGKGRGLGPP